jgi:hypothetical protein
VGLIRFYGFVLREAFRHSLDITQTIIFLALAVAGLIVARNPASKSMIEALDVGGWKMVAMVFGTILAIRLVLAPYWLWKSAIGRITEQPQNSIDWGLRLEHVNYLVDKKKKAIQVCFVLRSSINAPLRYEVEDVLVTIADKGVNSPIFDSMGAVISKEGTVVFYYPWILDALPKKGVGHEGFASITYKYGKATDHFVRRAKYVVKLINPGLPGAKFHTLEEAESNI